MRNNDRRCERIRRLLLMLGLLFVSLLVIARPFPSGKVVQARDQALPLDPASFVEEMTIVSPPGTPTSTRTPTQTGVPMLANTPTLTQMPRAVVHQHEYMQHVYMPAILKPNSAAPVPTVTRTRTPLNTPTPTRTRTFTPVVPTPTITPRPATPRPTETTAPVSQGRIAFWSLTSVYDNLSNIYVLNVDDLVVTRLKDWWGNDANPRWSPDGNRIAFESSNISNWHNFDIYIINADGTGLTRLTNHPSSDSSPTWSPDGRRIAFHTYRDTIPSIYVMNIDGSGQTKLTDGFDLEPRWSPDGSRIAFTSRRDGNFEIYTMNPDGSGQTRLTNNAAEDAHPVWSPDGSRIAFSSNRDGHYQIYVMNANGSGQTRLSHVDADDSSPTWSPDGDRIAFTSNRDGNYEIYAMNTDGSGQVRLTNSSAQDYGPDWSPSSGVPSWLYFDDFSNSASGWPTAEDSNWRIGYLDGEYQIKMKSVDLLGYVTGYACDSCAVEADARFASSTYGNYGLVFGAYGGDYYLFMVDNYQYYILLKWQGGSWSVLVDWTQSPHIHTGQAKNRLRVERYGTSISLYANGQHLTTLYDSSLLGIRGVGLATGAFDEVPVDARFDNFAVYAAPLGTGAAQVRPDAQTASMEGLRQ